MFGLELSFIWAGIIAFAVLVYVILDGFDLGVGLLPAVVDEQAAEGDYVHPRLVERIADEPDPLGVVEGRRLADVDRDGDHDPIEDVESAPDDVDVAHGDRIEGAGIEGDAHLRSPRVPDK